MKLIIAGTRTLTLTTTEIHKAVVASGFKHLTEIVSGKAVGVDTSGEHYAKLLGIKVSEFLADWDAHGKAAGHLRNHAMALYADALLLIWDGKSPGSRNMRKQMKALGKPVYEIIVKKLWGQV